MMGSPSSTATYLIHSSTWDDAAERYLRDVVRNGSGQRTGGVLSAWPTTVFETSWAITTLIESGVSIGEPEAAVIGDFLETSLQEHDALVGFEPRALPDADDTARTSMALCYLGRRPDNYIRALVNTFEAADHFRTYPMEMNPSISANFNVLSCLLLLSYPIPYTS
ncbi:hypothetical protein F4779DRAFT_31181 [Xylariaceae sp. FL0662B]|nr:hypothetical protein F4779DRAFT_31181 [Xylariaceae sp. FL0662B]